MEELKSIITEFRAKRDWEKYDNLERLEHFQWNESGDNMQEIKDELADVLIYALAMCYHIGEDPKEIIKEKLKDVARRYPEKR